MHWLAKGCLCRFIARWHKLHLCTRCQREVTSIRSIASSVFTRCVSFSSKLAGVLASSIAMCTVRHRSWIGLVATPSSRHTSTSRFRPNSRLSTFPSCTHSFSLSRRSQCSAISSTRPISLHSISNVAVSLPSPSPSSPSPRFASHCSSSNILILPPTLLHVSKPAARGGGAVYGLREEALGHEEACVRNKRERGR